MSNTQGTKLPDGLSGTEPQAGPHHPRITQARRHTSRPGTGSRFPALWNTWISSGLAAAFLAALPALNAPPCQAEEGGAPAISAIPEYRIEAETLIDTPGSSSSPAAGLLNPASWAIQPEGGFYFGWTEGTDVGNNRPERVQFVSSMRFLNFGYQRLEAGGPGGERARVSDYTVGLGFGDRSHTGGISYSWSGGDTDLIPRHKRLGLGSVSRLPWLSFGSAAVIDLDVDDYWIQGDLGLRPIGPRVTLFGDVVGRRGQHRRDWTFGGGVRIMPVPGVNLAAKVSDFGEETNLSLQVGLNLFPGSFRPSARMHLNRDQEHIATTYSVESGPAGSYLGRGLLKRGSQYPEISLKGPLAYRTYRFFDDRRRLLPLLGRIREMGEDPMVGGIVLNLSGMQIPAEMTWELRQQLAGFRATGKTVVVYMDRAGMAGYALATVADQIWMDPQGQLAVQGIALGRTYMRNLMDKLEIGVDELRFFTHKSAAESISRTSMSDADREQMQEFADDLYDYVAGTVTQARGITLAEWDRVIDEMGVLLPREAMAAGLVDSVGSMEDARKAASRAARRTTPDPAFTLDGVGGNGVWDPLEWGEPDRIAILYGIGECAMDSGIRGPLLAKKIRDAGKDPKVRAIVLRADSPGGDPLPSDLVARAMKEAAEEKPVIVSQGSVAASGGYWISMYADSILAAPITITGSIGVIGAYLYDNGFGDKIGFSYDQVKRGRSSDMDGGMMLPLVGGLPHRPMDEEERARAESLIRGLYKDFIEYVAEGRDMTPEEVDKVGQGRIYSGLRGRELGLVDELGGLWDAIRIAKAAAGMSPDARVEFVEEPQLGFIRLELPTPSFIGLLLGAVERASLGGGPAPPVPDADSPYSLDPEASELRRILGEAAFLRLPAPDRLYLESILRNPGSPLLMMDPVILEEDPIAR